jgi:hypothetical protein
MNQCNAFLERQLPCWISFIIARPYPQTKRPTALILFLSENNMDSYRTRTTTMMNHSKLNIGCHYVRNSNWRHRSETHVNMIVFDLEKRYVPALSRSGTGLVEGKKETIFFLVHLS